MSPRLYRHISKNVQAVSLVLDIEARSLRDAIAKNNQDVEQIRIRSYLLQLGAYAECRLLKLLNEPQAFLNDEIDKINLAPTQLEKWKRTVEVAFRKHYAVPAAALVVPHISHTAESRYTTLLDILESDLDLAIRIRNKLAHGQWAYPLNANCNAVDQDMFQLLSSLNALELFLTRRLITSFLDIILDLVVSKPTFERDFDHHMNSIEMIRLQKSNRSYDLWKQRLVDRRAR
ncbi:MAG: hypothetical protein RLN78_05410 [Phycisphaerales bacterium]